MHLKKKICNLFTFSFKFNVSVQILVRNLVFKLLFTIHQSLNVLIVLSFPLHALMINEYGRISVSSFENEVLKSVQNSENFSVYLVGRIEPCSKKYL
jgi:hypothetical protein